MLYNIGLFLLGHLIIGFIIGIKHVLVDGTYEDIKSHDMGELSGYDPKLQQIMENIINNKILYIVMITLYGYFALFTELQILYLHIKYFIRGRIRKYKHKRMIRRTNKLTKQINKYNKDYAHVVKKGDKDGEN